MNANTGSSAAAPKPAPNLFLPDRNAANLAPRFREPLQNIIAIWNKANPDTPVALFEGHRTLERQAHLYSIGRTIPGAPCFHSGKSLPIGTCPNHPLGLKVTNAMAGMSWHGYGLAADVVFTIKGKWSWASTLPWADLGTAFEGAGLEWAGSWKTFREQPHVQKTFRMQLSEALELFREGGLAAVWSKL